MFNHLFVKALIKGRIFYPGFFRIKLGEGKTLDFIGLNYYTRDFVRQGGVRIPGIFGGVCLLDHHRGVQKKNMLNWEIFPEGLARMVLEFSKYKLPILISENGICTEHDEERTEFIKSHLKALSLAIQGGAPVFGYLYWSLLDNFEWAEGFKPRFGLIGVDFKTQARTVKSSALVYAKICERGCLEPDD